MRLIKDFLGTFELMFKALFCYHKGLLACVAAPVLIPLSFCWSCIKIVWRIITLLGRQEYFIGKIGYFGAIAAGIAYAVTGYNNPMLKYAAIGLFILSIFGLIMDTITYGTAGALYYTIHDIWEADIVLGFWLTLGMCFEFPINFFLYLTPIVNVLVYRHRMKRDKKYGLYPPLDRYGRLDKEKLNMTKNPIYSRLIV